MHLFDLHNNPKDVSVANLNEIHGKNVKSIRMKKGGHLSKHITKVPATLICVSGDVEFEFQTGEIHEIRTGAMVNIPPHQEHWLNAKEESLLLLIL